MTHDVRERSRFNTWLLESEQLHDPGGFYEGEQEATAHQHVKPRWNVMCNKIQAGDHEEYHEKSLDVRLDDHLDISETSEFLEVKANDASDLSTTVEAAGVRVGHHRVLRAMGPRDPNVLAAVLLAVSDKDHMPAHIYLEWSEKGPGENARRFLFAGEGDVPPLTHEIPRGAIPDPDDRPVVHVGG